MSICLLDPDGVAPLQAPYDEPMSRASELAAEYRAAPVREAFLMARSNLPGPRANLELLSVAAAHSDVADLDRWAGLSVDDAPENTPEVFLACVGVAGLGFVVSRGDRSPLPRLRAIANDPRWRVRESVAIGLQAWGDADVPALLDEMERWAAGSLLEGRAAMAAICEPRLLRRRADVQRVLDILDTLTVAIRETPPPNTPDVRVLRKALGYGWSVAVAADPEIGLPRFERWSTDANADVRWIVNENRKKARLARLTPA
jgi:hypothetical protein